MPTVRATLKRAGLPVRLLSIAVQVITEKWRLNIFAELPCRFMSCKRNQSNVVRLRRLPLPVKPRTGHNKIGVLGVVLLRVAENLPRSPGIFLIPEPRNVQVRR